jgi:hypothetical protein
MTDRLGGSAVKRQGRGFSDTALNQLNRFRSHPSL